MLRVDRAVEGPHQQREVREARATIPPNIRKFVALQPQLQSQLQPRLQPQFQPTQIIELFMFQRFSREHVKPWLLVDISARIK